MLHASRPELTASESSKMKTFLRTLAEMPLRITHWYLGVLARWFPGVRYRWRDNLYSEIQSEYDEVFHTSPYGVVTLRFSTPNSVCRYRTIRPYQLEGYLHLVP